MPTHSAVIISAEVIRCHCLNMNSYQPHIVLPVPISIAPGRWHYLPVIFRKCEGSNFTTPIKFTSWSSQPIREQALWTLHTSLSLFSSLVHWFCCFEDYTQNEVVPQTALLLIVLKVIPASQGASSWEAPARLTCNGRSWYRIGHRVWHRCSGQWTFCDGTERRLDHKLSSCCGEKQRLSATFMI